MCVCGEREIERVVCGRGRPLWAIEEGGSRRLAARSALPRLATETESQSQNERSSSSPFSSDGWPSQDIRLLRGYSARMNHPFTPPRPPALFTLVQYYCTIIGQYTTPLPTFRFLCYTPFNIGHHNLV